MGLGDVLDKIEADIASSKTTETGGSETQADTNPGGAPESSQTTAPDTLESVTSQDLTELEKLGKFKFGGKEWTTEEAKKSWLRQQDYTKKTQTLTEREKAWEKQLSEAREQSENYKKFVLNYEIDIQNVLRDPNLAVEFKKVYPTEFHSILDKALQNQPQNGTPNGTSQQPTRDPYLESRLAQLERNLQSREQEDKAKIFQADVTANEAMLDSICDKLNKEFSLADEDAVLSRAEQLLSQMKPEQLSAPNFRDRWESVMEKLYKQSHDHHLGRYQARYKEQVDRQKQANSRGKDMGPGGAIPAKAPQRMRLKDVKNHIIDNMGN